MRADPNSLRSLQCVTFLSALEENGRIEDRLRVIGTKYLKSWFIVDFISSFPIYLIQGTYSRVPQLARLFRLFRLLRLFRMLSILRILNRWGKREERALLRHLSIFIPPAFSTTTTNTR